jgi:hypothetical protein
LNATLGPAISPPTNSATNTAAASKLPAIMLKKTNVAIVVSHFALPHDNSPFFASTRSAPFYFGGCNSP